MISTLKSIDASVPTLGSQITPMTTSLIVADRFGKQHKNVMQSINNIISTLESIGGDELNFQPISYRDKMNREKPAYTMDRDAFSVLVFGFNGAEALN